jgi:para-nitrobenzyl esterase
MASTVIETAAGTLEGFEKEGVRHFLGIPYGASTAGRARFLPPQPVEPWAGVRPAVDYGPIAPQKGLILGGDQLSGLEAAGLFRAHPGLPGNEDCLVLNVFAPSAQDAPRPVMVWLHGGYYNSGYGSEATDPKEIAMVTRGDVVVVTVNHRLGLHGFLHLGELAGEEYASSGMAGMLDLVQALEWVRDNIGAFGGAPENVTIFGCSGGGRKTSLLMAMPAARGLFRQAIVESGPAVRVLDADEGTARARRLLDALGVPESRALELQDVPMERLLEVVGALSAGAGQRTLRDARRGDPYAFGFVPVVDGIALEAQPYDPIAAPSSLDVPLIIGTNRAEMALFLKLSSGAIALDENGLRGQLEAICEDDADEIYRAYRSWSPDAAPIDVLVDVETAYMYRQPSIRLAERKAAGSAPVYSYRFDWRTPIVDGRLGACHGLEISFAWGCAAMSPMTGGAEVAALTDQINGAWLAFARGGAPHHEGLKEWPTYDAHRRSTLIFSEETSVEHDPERAARELWASIL